MDKQIKFDFAKELDKTEQEMMDEIADEAHGKFSELMGKYDVSGEDRELIYAYANRF